MLGQDGQWAPEAPTPFAPAPISAREPDEAPGVASLFDLPLPGPLPGMMPSPVLAESVRKAARDTAVGLLTLPTDLGLNSGADPVSQAAPGLRDGIAGAAGFDEAGLNALRAQIDESFAGNEAARFAYHSALSDVLEGSMTPEEAQAALAGYEGPLGDAIATNLPPVETSSPISDIVAPILQYGVPGVGTAGMVAKAARGAPWLVRGLAQLVGQAGTDFAVTDPEQAGTIGDLVGAGPTQTTRDVPMGSGNQPNPGTPMTVDSLVEPISRLGRRGAVAAEGAGITMGLMGAAKGARAAVDKVTAARAAREAVPVEPVNPAYDAEIGAEIGGQVPARAPQAPQEAVQFAQPQLAPAEPPAVAGAPRRAALAAPESATPLPAVPEQARLPGSTQAAQGEGFTMGAGPQGSVIDRAVAWVDGLPNDTQVTPKALAQAIGIDIREARLLHRQLAGANHIQETEKGWVKTSTIVERTAPARVEAPEDAAAGEGRAPTPDAPQPVRAESSAGTSKTFRDPTESVAAEPGPVKAVRPARVVTPQGREIDVDEQVFEADELVTSDRTGFPEGLQPRDRSRVASSAQVSDIAARLDPERLGDSRLASEGAPIVGADNVVESGNGRVSAIREAYARGGERAARYRAYVEGRGHDVTGMRAPVLIRRRVTQLGDNDRLAFTREANERDTLAFSATERAQADARALSDAAVELYRGGDVELAGNRDFVRAFMAEAVSPADRAGMIGPDGALSQDGVRRVRGALLAKAYGDSDILETLLEATDSNIRSIGGALTDAAPGIVQLRADVAAGRVPAALDIAPQLVAAAKMVGAARRAGVPLAMRAGQIDAFSGDVDPVVRAILEVMHHSDSLAKPVGRERLAQALRFYAQQAREAKAGADLFGAEPVRPGDILDLAKRKDRAHGQADQQPDLLAGAGGGQPPKQPGGTAAARGGDSPHGPEGQRPGHDADREAAGSGGGRAVGSSSVDLSANPFLNPRVLGEAAPEMIGALIGGFGENYRETGQIGFSMKGALFGALAAAGAMRVPLPVSGKTAPLFGVGGQVARLLKEGVPALLTSRWGRAIGAHHFHPTNGVAAELHRKVQAMRAASRDWKWHASKIAQHVRGNFSPAERALMSDWIERAELQEHGENAWKEADARVRAQADAIADWAERLGEQLADTGMIERATFERLRGHYLHRYYEKHVGERAGRRGRDTISATYGKPRGEFKVINQPTAAGVDVGDRIVAMTHATSGQVRYVPMRSNERARLGELGWIESKTWTVRDMHADGSMTLHRDFAPNERRAMGEIRDAAYRFAKGAMEASHDLALGRLFAALADDPRWASKTQREGWKHVPDGRVPGTGVSRYGRLAGMYVHPEAWTSLHLARKPWTNSNSAAVNRVVRTYLEALAMWKTGKTAFNPATHVRNFMSNAVMSGIAGDVGPVDIVRGMRALKSDAPVIEEARRAGLSLHMTGMLDDELRTLEKEILSDTAGDDRGAWARLLVFTLNNAATMAYNGGDQLFKVASYMRQRRLGKAPQEAVEHAHRYYFDYADVPLGVQAVADFYSPFFRYTYKALKAVAGEVAERPHRVAAVVGMMGALNLAAYGALYPDEPGANEDYEREINPDWMKGEGWMVPGTDRDLRLPWNETDPKSGREAALFLNTTYYMPGGAMLDVTSQAALGPSYWLPLVGGTPWGGNPIVSGLVGLLSERDPFTGRDLYPYPDTDLDDPDAPDDEKAANVAALAKWLAGQALPPWIAQSDPLGDVAVNEGVIDRDAWIAGVMDWTGTDREGREVSLLRTLGNLLGVRVTAVDPETQEKWRKIEGIGRMRDAQREIGVAVRNKGRSEASVEARRHAFEAARDRFVEDQRQLRELRQEAGRE